MKKLTNEQIVEELKKITDQFFCYFGGHNLIKLNGTFASDELRAIADKMDELYHSDEERNKIKKLDIKGFTAKDIKVIYYKQFGGWCYSFLLMKDGRDYDFYYGKSDDKAGKWWPEVEDEYGFTINLLYDFIPDGFREACENTYQYHGSNEEALELFKDCGFTVERGEDYD